MILVGYCSPVEFGGFRPAPYVSLAVALLSLCSDVLRCCLPRSTAAHPLTFLVSAFNVVLIRGKLIDSTKSSIGESLEPPASLSNPPPRRAQMPSTLSLRALSYVGIRYRSRQALLDLQRAGRAGARIEHILPHLDSSGSNISSSSNGAAATSGGGGGGGVRAVSPDLPASKQPRLQDATGISGTAMPSSGGGNKESGATSGSRGGSSSPALLAATPLRSQSQRFGGPLSSSGVGGSGGGGSAGTPPGLSSGSGAGTFGGEFSLGGSTGGGALTSIANPELVSSATKGLRSVQSFRGRGGAFGMLLHKVQAGQTPVRPPGAGIFDGIDSVGGGGKGGKSGGASGRSAGSGDGTSP